MKKKLFSLFLVIILILSLTACGQKDNSVSKGMNKLGEKTVELYEQYTSGDIDNSKFISELEDINNQAADIVDSDFPRDYFVKSFIEELYEKVQNEFCDIDDFELPYNDLKAVLEGTYEHSKYNTNYDFEDEYFYLTEEWIQEEDNTYWLNDSIMLQTTYISDGSALIDDEYIDTFVSAFNSDGTANLSNDYDVYKTRNLNYFYIVKGTFEDTNRVVTAITSNVDGENYVFMFISKNTEVPEETLYSILDSFSSLD